jgi:hypothetical protein
MSSPFLKVFHLFRKGGNRFGDEKSLGRKKENSIFNLPSPIFKFSLEPYPTTFHPTSLNFGKEKTYTRPITLSIKFPFDVLGPYF